jgi:cupin fold WbuC family metalloprotein
MHLIGPALFARVLDQARQSPRRRMNYNFHPAPDSNPHRFLNVLLRGTYITPHRHLDPPKSETFLALEGHIAFFLFDDRGAVLERHDLGPGQSAFGLDIEPGLRHTIAALSDHAVCFEVKPGPSSPMSDKEFAPWAPREGDPRAAAYLASLLE